MAWFGEGGELVEIDRRTPLDFLEPEDTEGVTIHSDLTLAEIVFRVCASFREGDPLITAAAWTYVLRGDDSSMRRRAKQLGVSTAAVSRRARILAGSFGLRLSDPHIRALRRRLALASWARRKRRAGPKNDPPPAVSVDEQPAHQGGRT